MNERVRSTELRVHVKHVFSFSGFAVALRVLKHIRQAVVHQVHPRVRLHEAACDGRRNLAGKPLVFGKELNLFIREIAVVQTIT